MFQELGSVHLLSHTLYLNGLALGGYHDVSKETCTPFEFFVNV